YYHSRLWYDPDLNSLAFYYRSDTSTIIPRGKFYYSYSLDGGINWQGDTTTVYKALTNGGVPLYPECVIYNLPGNVIDSNAFVSHFSPTTDTVPTSFGVAYGSGK